MELFFVGTLVGIVVSNVWNVLIGPGLRRRPPPDDDSPKLTPPRKKRRP